VIRIGIQEFSFSYLVGTEYLIQKKRNMGVEEEFELDPRLD
jgi:hypothetical protein